MFSPSCVFSFIFFGKLRLKIAVVICPLTNMKISQQQHDLCHSLSSCLPPSLCLSLSASSSVSQKFMNLCEISRSRRLEFYCGL